MNRAIVTTLLKAKRPDLARAVVAATVTVAADRKLDRALRERVNSDLARAGFDGNGRFRSIGQALNKLSGILQKHGIEEDDVYSADLFRGDQGHRTFNIAFSNPDDAFSPQAIGNSMLTIQWFQHRAGALEVLSYLS